MPLYDGWDRPLFSTKAIERYEPVRFLGKRWNAGEMVFYCGRLAEVVVSSNKNGNTEVELTDEGGIVHRYGVRRPMDLRPLIGPGECALDAIRQATTPGHCTPTDLRRQAEVWLADPQEGDAFKVCDELMEILHIGEGGTILCSFMGPKQVLSGGPVRGMSFPGPHSLRNYLKAPDFPVYKALAISSLRPHHIKKLPSSRGVK